MSFISKCYVLFFTCFLVSCGDFSDDDPLVLKYSSPYGMMHLFSKADGSWVKYVHDISDGQIVIRPHWSASLVSADHSMMELRHGVSDIAFITPIYERGGTHLLRLQTAYYNKVTTFEDQVKLYSCIEAFSEDIAKEMEGVVLLAVQGGTAPGLITTDKVVKTLQDLQGLRIRAPTEMMEVLEHFGADPVFMPMGEVYSALAKGVIDGVIAPPESFGSMHFEEVSKYYTRLRIPRGAYPARAMNEKVWETLTPKQQQILLNARPFWEREIGKEIKAASADGERVALEKGLQFYEMPAADIAEFVHQYERLTELKTVQMASYNIDARSAFESAQASILENGDIECSSAHQLTK